MVLKTPLRNTIFLNLNVKEQHLFVDTTKTQIFIKSVSAVLYVSPTFANVKVKQFNIYFSEMEVCNIIQ